MNRSSSCATARLLPATLLLLVIAQTPALGERLPVRSFNIDDGLPSDDIRRIVPDSAGYLWLLTAQGLSRFDGRVFTTLGPEHGLPEGRPRDLLETSDGVFLVAMMDGVYWYDTRSATGDPLFSVARPVASGDSNIINSFHEDREGRLWCGTHFGLFRMVRTNRDWRFERIEIGRRPDDIQGNALGDILDDENGALWIATPGGLLWRGRDGSLQYLNENDGLPPLPGLYRLVEDDNGRIWGAAAESLVLMRPDPRTGRPEVLRTVGIEEGLPDPSGLAELYRDILWSSDGTLWAAGYGLVHVVPRPESDTWEFRSYGVENGLSTAHVMALAEDNAGNLWVGSSDSGIMRIAHGGLVSFTTDDGLSVGYVGVLFEDDEGRLNAVTRGRPRVATFDGERFHEVEPSLPEGILDMGWGTQQIHFQDRLGEWWFGTYGGLVRFPPVGTLEDLASLPPRARYTMADGLLSDGVFRVMEDSNGDLWIGLMNYREPGRNGLQRWDRRTGTFQTYGAADGVPRDAPTAFFEDGNGDLWVGFYSQGIGRLRDGKLTRFGEAEGGPPGHIGQFFEDRSGRLWVTTRCCRALRIEDRRSGHPRFVREPVFEGLRTTSVFCITDDDYGRYYLGSELGLHRWDPATGELTHYTRRDGLLDNLVFHALRQSDGTLWFATAQGISRLVPEPDRRPQPAPVVIRGLRAGGNDRPVSPFGEREISDLDLPYASRQVELEFSTPGFAVGHEPLFQYRLGGGRGAWSPPSDDRTIHFANLASGRYSLEIRAVGTTGAERPAPATVRFRVLPPIWRSGWFLALVGLIIGSAAVAVHRMRMERALGLERVRTRIATDLHDDIGASLSQVAILSEVVRQQVGDAYPSAASTLAHVADTARQLVESMSDIVWAVNPKHDKAVDLVQRMRRFASDTLSGKDIALRFEASPEGSDRRLDVGLRRQVFLIFKEAVNNAARHSGCSSAEVRVQMDGRTLKLDVVDDGIGFEAGPDGNGHGLDSMQARARQLGGSFRVESHLNMGTAIRLTVPLRA